MTAEHNFGPHVLVRTVIAEKSVGPIPFIASLRLSVLIPSPSVQKYPPRGSDPHGAR